MTNQQQPDNRCATGIDRPHALELLAIAELLRRDPLAGASACLEALGLALPADDATIGGRDDAAPERTPRPVRRQAPRPLDRDGPISTGENSRGDSM